jgi:catechol 2,3-dioxygenase-like lactoylglutathione lyase family enzyme
MKLELFFIPTSDLDASLALYRDGLGFTELWREGDTTAALTLPGSEAQIMLDASGQSGPAGPMFVVDSVPKFHETRPGALTVLDEPAEIPGGFLAAYQEPGGSVFYVLDQSSDAGDN